MTNPPTPEVRRPNVLVCTVACWNDEVGADTFSALFDDYGVDRLANLYIREEVPNSAVCERYFKISESAIIRSVLHRDTKTGKEWRGEGLEPDADDAAALQETRRRYERHRRGRNWLLLYAREILWGLGRWRTPELDAFIEDFKPDVVVFGMEGYIHFNRINRYIVRKSGAGAIGYFYDDNFTYRQRPWSLGYRLYRFFQRRDLKRTAAVCSAFFAISPKTKRECDAFFGVESILLTKPVMFRSSEWSTYSPHQPIRMLYTGNLLIGRLQSLKLLGDALAKVNRRGQRINLDVYTTTAVSEAEARDLDPSVHLHGPIPQGDVSLKQREADILLFVEDLVGPDAKTARLSFSTKLTDYFQSGKCIFAIGDRDIAPIEYLQAEDAAICATSVPEILQQLECLASDSSVIVGYAEKAFACGRRNHEEQLVKRRLHDTIARVAGTAQRGG